MFCFIHHGYTGVDPPIQMANALPTQDGTMADIYEEADKINDIMNQKIENHPGLSDVDGHCYNSIEALEKCQKEVTEEMEPYYEEAGKRLSDKIDQDFKSLTEEHVFLL